MHDLVNAYVRQGRYAQAEPVLRRIIGKFPIDTSAHLLLGKALEKSGEFEAARLEYSATLHLDPGNQEAKSGLDRLETK